MDDISGTSPAETLLSHERNMDLVGERVMKAARKIAQTISTHIDLDRVTNDRAYLYYLQDNLLEPTIIKYAKKEKLIIQAYFEMLPDLTPQLTPEDEIVGVVLADTKKRGNFQRGELIRVKEFHPGNPFMNWFYEPVRQGKGVWSNVYFDPYINQDVISYNLPVYRDGKLLGVVGLDLDYRDFRKTMNDRLIEDIGSKIELIKKEHEILGQSDNFSGQYIRVDTLELVDKDEIFEGCATYSKEMTQVMNMAVKAALSSANILILGETGVGKDFIASYIHSKSKMRNGPFINVNCSAIPESLLESEFFGYEKGAFTGAKSEGKPGYFEAANGGTIFLNEIGEIPFHLQAKFLTVIQQKMVTRVGGTVPKRIDFRLIAATNRNLLELVKQGKFREDLYYRLNVIPIRIPPLRDRKEDILSLLTYFLHKNMEKYQVKRRFSPEILDILINYRWPGNIRELENLVERLVVTSEGPVIDLDALPPEFDRKAAGANPEECVCGDGSLKDMLREYEASIIRKKFAQLGSSYKVAKALKISQSQANSKIREYVYGGTHENK